MQWQPTGIGFYHRFKQSVSVLCPSQAGYLLAGTLHRTRHDRTQKTVGLLPLLGGQFID